MAVTNLPHVRLEVPDTQSGEDISGDAGEWPEKDSLYQSGLQVRHDFVTNDELVH